MPGRVAWLSAPHHDSQDQKHQVRYRDGEPDSRLAKDQRKADDQRYREEIGLRQSQDRCPACIADRLEIAGQHDDRARDDIHRDHHRHDPGDLAHHRILADEQQADRPDCADQETFDREAIEECRDQPEPQAVVRAPPEPRADIIAHHRLHRLAHAQQRKIGKCHDPGDDAVAGNDRLVSVARRDLQRRNDRRRYPRKADEAEALRRTQRDDPTPRRRRPVPQQRGKPEIRPTDQAKDDEQA